MEWKRLDATFGALEEQTLTLHGGFDLIYAPNESGKSTWCAFMRAMLYGLPTRDRRLTAEKNRYLPWSGKAPRGRAEVLLDGKALTLARTTARPGNPLGVFSACYAGTAMPVPGLNGADCGDQLTGVPREVFERSAFISQSGMIIEQDAALERCIASLMAAGEEDVSCTEAAERLKKQLYRRRYNKSGTLPAAEAEIARLQEQLERSRALRRRCEEESAALAALEQREEALSRELLENAGSAGDDSRRQAALLRAQAAQAEALVERRRAEADAYPEQSVLKALRSALASASVNRLTLKNAAAQLQLRRQEREAAEAGVAADTLFAPLTGEEGREKAARDAAHHAALLRRGRCFTALTALPLLIAAALALLCVFRPGTLPLWTAALPLPLIPVLLIAARRCKTQAEALAAAYGDGAFQQRAEAYYIIYERFAAAKAAEKNAEERHRRLTEELTFSVRQVLTQVQRFAPDVHDLTAAAHAIDEAMAVRSRYEAALRSRDELAARMDTLPPAPADEAAAGRTEPLQKELQAVREGIRERRRALSEAQGQLQLVGAAETLTAQLEEKERFRAAAQREYDALAMALEALTEADAALQRRFSPELGKRSAKYFAKLTKGKYNTVLLDKTLEASAQQSGSDTPRPFWQLSQGTAEQMYLAVRLAICEMVLKKDVPLVLDDALSSFDDDRMAAALDVLREIAAERQVIFFTCQRREEAYLRQSGAEDVHYQSLGSTKEASRC